MGKPFKKGESAGRQLKVSLRREGNPQWQLELIREASVDLEERGVEVYKVVAVDVIWQVAGKNHKLFDLGA